MAGGMGAEWYFGAFQPQQDLNTEDWSTYDQAWRWTNQSLKRFGQLPFQDLDLHNELVNGFNYCMSDKKSTSVVYFPVQQAAKFDLTWAEGPFKLQWLSPMAEEDSHGSSHPMTSEFEERVVAPAKLDLNPPGPGDWIALIRAE